MLPLASLNTSRPVNLLSLDRPVGPFDKTYSALGVLTHVSVPLTQISAALSSTSWLQQTPQQQQPPEQQLQPEEPNKPEEPSEEQQPEKKAPKKSKKLKDAENKKEMVVNMPTSPISQLISAEALAGKDKSMLMRPQAEQHHGFVTPPPSVLPRIDSASSLVGGTPTSGYHQVPDLHHQSHGSPVLTPEHPSSLVGVPHHPLQQPHEVLSAQMQLFQASQQQQLFLQMAALNPAVIQQYQMYMMALQQQQQKLQQFQSPQNSSAASPFHVMPTTSHDVQVDIEASPPTPESFPGDIDTISMAMDTSDSGSSSSAQDQMIEEMDDDEIMSRIEKARLSDKEALAVLVLAGLANQ
ncbi:hypothetical protein L596_010692 [Steinernema carpocapsae]|uniref:Uncharacterized protein n=1 Tax=Steinernema carpocapsae TaxID=34508 RepID=A0A4U5PJD1_STECR|nr:hypothetical protein L596_010692 [Steinernema carpocapsae]